MSERKDFFRMVEALPRLARTATALPTGWDLDLPTAIARAPGRLDVMGGIADYSGSLVLQMPLAEATLCAAQPRTDHCVEVVSIDDLEHPRVNRFNIETNRLTDDLARYDNARSFFAASTENHWAAYVIGPLIALQRDAIHPAKDGISLLVYSEVPIGKGVSSSAALEVAVMMSVLALNAINLPAERVALLCQEAENRVAGAPCGIMDQMTSVLGQRYALLALNCQPAVVEGFVRLPDGVSVWGIDSGIRHAVGGSDYEAVRTGAFIGYRIITDLLGLPSEVVDVGRVCVLDKEYDGYLANIPVDLATRKFEDRLPVEISGLDFLERYGGITDGVVRVDPARNYPVRAPTMHPILEQQRVALFRELLSVEPTSDVLTLLGTLMYQSHHSYSACGLGSDGTDRLVELVQRAGPAAGLFGARITGGGSGGTVAVIGRSDADEAVKQIAADYSRETGMDIRVFDGSSMGAAHAGVMRLPTGSES